MCHVVYEKRPRQDMPLRDIRPQALGAAKTDWRPARGPSHNISGPLKNGEWLKVGKSLWSPDGSVELKMQEDGKLAVYWEGECRFQTTDEQRDDIQGIHMQEDGNFVISDNDGNAVWASDTAEPTGDSTIEVSVQDDGNVVFYKKTAIGCSETHK